MLRLHCKWRENGAAPLLVHVREYRAESDVPHKLAATFGNQGNRCRVGLFTEQIAGEVCNQRAFTFRESLQVNLANGIAIPARSQSNVCHRSGMFQSRTGGIAPLLSPKQARSRKRGGRHHLFAQDPILLFSSTISTCVGVSPVFVPMCVWAFDHNTSPSLNWRWRILPSGRVIDRLNGANAYRTKAG